MERKEDEGLFLKVVLRQGWVMVPGLFKLFVNGLIKRKDKCESEWKGSIDESG